MSAPCLKCGVPTDLQLEFEGLLTGTVFMCVECRDDALVSLAEHRRQFQELIDAGVDRRSANMTMIGRIDAERTS